MSPRSSFGEQIGVATVGNRVRSLRDRLQRMARPPLDARHVEWSVVASMDDDPHGPSERLVGLALDAIGRARSADMDAVSGRARADLQRRLIENWPGEHYRLLAGLVGALRPRIAIDIGTYTGMSALVMRSTPPHPKVVTYDLVPWDEFEDSLLTSDDFTSDLEQRLVDLGDPAVFERQRETLSEADLIFVDGPKDRSFERRVLSKLIPALSGRGAIVVLDDIRLLTMVSIWRDLPIPKLDLTSFGHWCGTGIAEIP